MSKIKNTILKTTKLFTSHITMTSVIGPYNIDELSHKKEITLDEDLQKDEVKNFILIPKNTTIIFNNTKIPADESSYYRKLLNIFKQLEIHEINYNIKIYVHDRNAFIKSGLLENIKNINLTINYLFYDYTKEEFIEEETRLENLIQPIKDSNLSPYEKYLAVYNLVKNFKAYNEHPSDPKQSRCIRYILENEYMVCVGFASLLEILLNKINIPTIRIYLDVDAQRGQGDNLYFTGHQRNIVKIDDDKYNIHGIYIADPTADNDINKDLYLYSNITFDRTKESKTLEYLNLYDLLLDFHTFDEFQEKINHYLKRKISASSKRIYKKKIIDSYTYLYCYILNILCTLDHKRYLDFSEEYNETIYELKKKNVPLQQLEQIFSDFLVEYYNYIIKLTNKKIEESSTYQALNQIKEKLLHQNKTEITLSEKITKKENKDLGIKLYPYCYNSLEPRKNYLTSESQEQLPKKLKKLY